MTDSQKLDLLLEKMTKAEKIADQLEEIKTDVSVLKNDVAVLKDDVATLKDDVATLKTDVAVLKDEVATLKNEVSVLQTNVTTLNREVTGIKNRLDSVEVTLDHKMKPILYDIISCYISTYDRYRNSVEEQEAMKTDVSVLKEVVTRHSSILHSMKQNLLFCKFYNIKFSIKYFADYLFNIIKYYFTENKHFLTPDIRTIQYYTI